MSAVFIALCYTPEFRQNNNIFLCVRQGALFGLILHIYKKDTRIKSEKNRKSKKSKIRLTKSPCMSIFKMIPQIGGAPVSTDTGKLVLQVRPRFL